MGEVLGEVPRFFASIIRAAADWRRKTITPTLRQTQLIKIESTKSDPR